MEPARTYELYRTGGVGCEWTANSTWARIPIPEDNILTLTLTLTLNHPHTRAQNQSDDLSEDWHKSSLGRGALINEIQKRDS